MINLRLILLILLLMLPLSGYSQLRIMSSGDAVYFNNQHVFSICATDYGLNSEYVVNNLKGEPLLVFVPFKIQSGWGAESHDSQYGSSQSKSGTIFTFFYRVASTTGEFCDVPAKGITSSRGVAKLLISFGLIKADALDQIVFQQFCLMHGKVHENLKYFK